VPINIAQATLGSRIRVRTVDDKHVVLRIPPGTQSGTRFRIKGQGVRKEQGQGDQYVRVEVRSRTGWTSGRRRCSGSSPARPR
jgi:molecular chaperone DnaJ